MIIYGVDVPLVEFFVIIIFVMVVFFAVLVWLLVKFFEMNKKLDLVLRDEKKFHSELRETKEEEDEQLGMMRKIVKELAILDKVVMSEKKQLNYIKDNILAELKGVRLLKGRSPMALKQLKEFVKKVEHIDKINEQESDQLERVKHLIDELEKTETKKSSKKGSEKKKSKKSYRKKSSRKKKK
ncbi:hypothetical protein GF351_01795 [Candidatus Woesearchaeota archaeon]|nr:hypothetical protein [Candidatus Woesearchaeota archaeon]